MATCTTCAEDDPSKFSKRMLAGAWARKGAPVRCKSCISEAERAEAAQAAVNAASKAAIKAADGEIKQERCAGCSKMLAPSAFSRSQLLQRARRSAAGRVWALPERRSAAACSLRPWPRLGAPSCPCSARYRSHNLPSSWRGSEAQRLRRSLLRLCAAEWHAAHTGV